MTDDLRRWMRYDHLPPHLQDVSAIFRLAADQLCASVPPGRERTVALRKLLEAKDAGVRACIEATDDAATSE